MKNKMRKALCLMLALLMFASLMSIGAFADKSVKQYKDYLCLGDSIASGYGLPSYEATVDPWKGTYLNEDIIHDGSYAQIVADAVGAKVAESRAHSGWRTADYLDMMGYKNLMEYDPYISEVGADFFITGMGWLKTRDNPQLVGSGERAIESIKKANLITINLGCNDVFSYAQGVTMATVSNRLGWASLYDVPNSIADVNNTFTSLIKTMATGDVKELLSTYVGALIKGSELFEAHLPKFLNIVKQLNPDATIVIVGMTCPLSINFPVDLDALGVDIYSYFDYFCDKENKFMQDLAVKNGCLFADVSGADCWGTKVLDATGIFEGSLLGVEVSGIKMVHPSEEGHAYMAKKILAVLPGYDGEIPSLPFVDVPEGSWYYDAVEYCYDRGITQGTDATHFSPTSSVTRGQLATFLYRMAGSPSVAGQYETFNDVYSNAYYYNAVVWAQNKGVVTGYDSTTFGPNNTVTRAEAVTMLARYAGVTEASASYSQFTDAYSIPTYACGAVSWAKDNNIVSGYPDGSFRPGNPLSRAEMATILTNYSVNYHA